MLDIVEVFWNARPHLQRLGIKVGANTLDPRADQLFADVRLEIGKAFPGAVALVRISTRGKDVTADLRMVRGKAEIEGPELETVRTLINEAIDRANEPVEATAAA